MLYLSNASLKNGYGIIMHLYIETPAFQQCLFLLMHVYSHKLKSAGA